jgi:hypothetical protein
VVVRVDHATEPAGAVTVGVVPQALNVVVKSSTTAPSETEDVYVIGRSELCEMTSDPVPAGMSFAGGTTPEMRTARTPAAVILVADVAFNGI